MSEEEQRPHSELIVDISKADSTDLCIVFVKEGFMALQDLLSKLIKYRKEHKSAEAVKFDLTFLLSDLGKTDEDKKLKLRNLKALLENSRYRENGISFSVVVLGETADDTAIEPNVFSSGVQFKLLEEEGML